MAQKTTAYNLVAQSLRNRILSGNLQPGSQLPPERVLCAEFGVSRITIRRAMRILEEELLVRRRQGRGTFVSAALNRRIPIRTQEFSASLRRHAPGVRRRLDAMRRQTAKAELADLLNTFVGDAIVYVRRLEHLRRVPVSMDEVWLLMRYADRLKKSDFGRLNFLERWQRVQRITLSYSAQSVEAAPATAPIARLLRVKRGTPLLKESEVIYLQSEQPAALIVSHYRHKYFRLTATVRLAEK